MPDPNLTELSNRLHTDASTHNRGTTPKFNRDAIATRIAALETEQGPGNTRILITGATKAQIRSLNAELARRGITTRTQRQP